jgi:hypothetical protein
VLWSLLPLHPGISPLSRYGDRVTAILPSVLPAALHAPVGFHRFEPVDECDRSHSGQFHLPDKEFRYLRTVR